MKIRASSAFKQSSMQRDGRVYTHMYTHTHARAYHIDASIMHASIYPPVAEHVCERMHACARYGQSVSQISKQACSFDIGASQWLPFASCAVEIHIGVSTSVLVHVIYKIGGCELRQEIIANEKRKRELELYQRRGRRLICGRSFYCQF